MNKYQKAIKVLNYPKQVKGGIKYTDPTNIACGADLVEVTICSVIKTAIEALKKQIPQKIQKSPTGLAIYGCPSCDYSDSLWRCGKHDKHCPNCGQMLDWSEKE